MKADKIHNRFSKKLKLISPNSKISSEEGSTSKKTVNSDEAEIITQLKEKFAVSGTRAEQVQILTILPTSWSTEKVQKEFGVANYMARQAKKLVKEQGILSLPNKRESRFPQETMDQVAKFYKSQEVSRIMAGKKDYKTVLKQGQRVQEQKYLILCNLKEAYQLFKSKNPEVTISFSKFADLRPKECVLAGSSGTHSVCVCTIHQNMKLMILGTGLPALTGEEKFHLTDYRQCLNAVVCNPASTDCYFSQCSKCSHLTTDFELFLTEIFNKNMIDEVQYKQWLSTDRTTLETVLKSTDEFIESFCRSLHVLKRHDFIAKEQSAFCSKRKESLKNGEVLVIGDFAENYSFILQDAAQGFHWNNAQATLHPFVCYYRDGEDLKHINVVVISDCLNHDTVAVHLYQRKLIDFLKAHLDFDISHMIYFSDGAASQYKNYKNFVNLCNHTADFGITAEWHFFATSHGKGPCDGVGGTVKRLAARASLQRPYNDQIMTPRQFFEYGRDNIPGINFFYSSKDEWIKEEHDLEERFHNASTIPGTQKLHSFVPVSRGELEVKTVSSLTQEAKKVRVTKQDNNIQFEDIRGFVTAIYDNEWWLACVLETYSDSVQVKLNFLRPKGPSSSFQYPSRPDILVLPFSEILNVVDPMSATGRNYKLTETEMEKASQILEHR